MITADIIVAITLYAQMPRALLRRPCRQRHAPRARAAAFMRAVLRHYYMRARRARAAGAANQDILRKDARAKMQRAMRASELPPRGARTRDARAGARRRCSMRLPRRQRACCRTVRVRAAVAERARCFRRAFSPRRAVEESARSARGSSSRPPPPRYARCARALMGRWYTPPVRADARHAAARFCSSPDIATRR